MKRPRIKPCKGKTIVVYQYNADGLMVYCRDAKFRIGPRPAKLRAKR